MNDSTRTSTKRSHDAVDADDPSHFPEPPALLLPKGASRKGPRDAAGQMWVGAGLWSPEPWEKCQAMLDASISAMEPDVRESVTAKNSQKRAERPTSCQNVTETCPVGLTKANSPSGSC